MEKLKVGDKLYQKSSSRYTQFTDYIFGTVERITKTQAILSNGYKIINDPKVDWYNKDIYCFSQYGDSYKRWFIQTNEIIKEANAENKRKKIYYWFRDKQFSDEEKLQVFNLLNK